MKSDPPFPDNFFDDYAGRGTGTHIQEVRIVKWMMWGHDMEFGNGPYMRKPANFAPFF